MERFATPRLVCGEAARSALLGGVDLMVRLVRPTLGPVARSVAVAPILGSRAPEVLDSAAMIARRAYAVRSRSDNVGAMLVRHLAWRVYEQVGDGAATAVVLAGRLLHEADRLVAAGIAPVALARGVEHGLGLAVDELQRQARPVEAPSELVGLVTAALGHPELAEMVAEVVDSVGPDGAVLIEDAYGPKTQSEYVDGVRWNEGWLSPAFQVGTTTSLQIVEPRILVTDIAIERPQQLVSALEACLAHDVKRLFVITPSMTDAALALLLLNRDRGVLEQAVAVRAPSFGTTRTRITEDLAAVTGGRCIRLEAGERLEDVRFEDLGSARQAWARRSQFGILGGRGNRAAIRQRIGEARGELKTIVDDDWLRAKTQERIGKLAGSAAVILVGAPTTTTQAELKVRIEAAVATARAALREGLVPGGGAAFVACAARLEQQATRSPKGTGLDDEALGTQALARALGEPMAVIAHNAGYVPAPILHDARRRGSNWTFDALKGQWVDPWQSGLLDSVAVLDAALRASVSLAVTALTTEVIVHRKRPPVSVNP